MSRRPQAIAAVVLSGAIAVVLTTSGCAAWRISKAVELARLSEPFQQRPSDATVRLLVVGDSTAVGSGADSPAASVAGRLASEHARLWVENRARDGARLADVPAQLDDGDERFDIGNAPFFFVPVSWWMTRRSRELHGWVRAAAALHGAVYINLFKERDHDRFVREPGLHARDGLHPSDAGHAAWLQELMAQSSLESALSSAR